MYNHLGLTPARALLGHLENFQSELREEEATLDGRVSELRKRVEGCIALLEEKRSEMLGSPPWGEGNAPALTEIESKARQLIEKIADVDYEPPAEGASVWALIQAAELVLENRSAERTSTLRRKLIPARARLGRLQAVQDRLNELHKRKAATAAARSNLADELEGKSLEDFRRTVDERRRQADTLALRGKLATMAIEVIRREEGSELVLCPICRRDHDRKALESVLEVLGEQRWDEELAEWKEAEQVLEKVEALAADVDTRERDEAELRGELDSMLKAIEGIPDQSVEKLDGKSLTGEITAVSEQIRSLEGQKDNQIAWFNEIKRDLEVLGVEAKYHDLQKKLRNLRSVEMDFDRATNVFGILVQFVQSVRTITKAVASTLTDELRVRTPAVADDMSQVFAALTRHPHFDRLTFNDEKLPGLEMRVSSSGFPGAKHPTGVLNGQAQSALDLVPYFALGGGRETPTEVYLVLLDDPTRAFDKEHIAILIDRLAELGQRVQVVVASQETETFRELLPRSFDRADYVMIEPKKWSFDGGPVLEIEYE